VPPWVLPAFARRFDLPGLAADNFRRVYRRRGKTSVAIALAAISSMAGDMIRWTIAAPLGLAVAHPFQDPRVLCLGLGILERLSPRPEPMKPVLAEAMGNLLPEQIRARRAKGHFSEVFYLGLGKNLDLLDELIEATPLSELGIVEKSRLRAHLEDARLATANPWQLRSLSATLSFIRWWSLQDEWTRKPWTADRQLDLTAVATGV
jgi:asparagine synthase (glutamine-hydrolysing)